VSYLIKNSQGIRPHACPVLTTACCLFKHINVLALTHKMPEDGFTLLVSWLFFADNSV
jgi:hypothetical protein